MAMCVRNINFICVSMIFLIDIGTVLPMWYLLCVILQQNNHVCHYTTEQSFKSNAIQNNVEASICFRVCNLFCLNITPLYFTSC